MFDKIICTSPLRVDFCHGGASDLPIISKESGGAVLNLAINLNNKRISCEITPTSERHISFISKDNANKTVIRTFDELSSLGDITDPFRLHKAALITSNILGNSKGSSVDLAHALKFGIEISTRTGLPTGTGLGVSGILGATILSGLFRLAGKKVNRKSLSLLATNVERLIGSGGGWQDPLGGIYGGLKYTECPHGESLKLYVRNIYLNESVINDLNERMVICYTGKSHFSGDVLSEIIRDFRTKKQPQYDIRLELKKLDQQIIKSLEQGNLDEFATLLSVFWEGFIKLVPAASSKNTDKIFDRVKNLAVGGKGCGAGGGGCVFLIAAKNKTSRLRQTLLDLFLHDTSFENACLFKTEIDFTGLKCNALRRTDI